MENADVARVFFEMADLLELRGAEAFRVRAYRAAAQAIDNLPEPVGSLVRRGTLTEVPSIGKGIARRVEEILSTGSCRDHLRLRGEFPQGLLEMMRVEGVGPKTARLLYERLSVASVDQLEQAAREGKIAALPRQGEKRQQNILHAIESYRKLTGRYRLDQALAYGETLCSRLLRVPGVERVEIAGSARRRMETVGDLDILAISSRSETAIGAFVRVPEAVEVLAKGPTKAAVRLRLGMHCDLRVLPRESFGAALHYFTGSKLHNIAVRTLALRRGLKLSEYGIFIIDGQRIGGATEEEVFRSVDLPFIPPELREDRGEIEAAAEGRLPKLVDEEDLLGDLHSHTKETDGRSPLHAMAEAAQALGLKYLAITDHSQARAVTNGLNPQRLRAQGEQIRRMNEQLPRLRLLRGIEADILPDGSVDLGPEVLSELEIVVASVHSLFGMDSKTMTARVVRAIESGTMDILGHPTGRLLGQRPPYALDMEQVLRAAGRAGVALEVNSFPDRLDLNDIHCRMAREMGVPVVISTDSHNTTHLQHRRFGVYMARRGWLEAKHVLNTRPVEELLEHFRSHHAPPARPHAPLH